MKKVFLIFIIILWLPQISSASVCSQVRAGNRFYEQGDFPKALERYQQALKKAENSDIVNFNLGAALYKNEEYEQAITHFYKALLSADESLRQKAQYNLGNTFYKRGINREEADLNFAIQSLEQGLEFYAQAMTFESADDKVHHNYEFVKSELERLKEKQQQQQQQQDKTCPLPKDEPDSEQQDDQPQPRPQDQPSEQARDKDASGQRKEPDQNDEESRSSSAAQEQESKSPEQSSPETSDPRQDQDRMSEHEAQMRLEHYQRSEEPRGLLNLNPNRRDDPVDKDW